MPIKTMKGLKYPPEIEKLMQNYVGEREIDQNLGSGLASSFYGGGADRAAKEIDKALPGSTPRLQDAIKKQAIKKYGQGRF